MGIWQRRGAEGSPKDGEEKHRLTDVHQAERGGIREAGTRGLQKGLQETELIKADGLESLPCKATERKLQKEESIRKETTSGVAIRDWGIQQLGKLIVGFSLLEKA